jgi:hypothetical protein
MWPFTFEERLAQWYNLRTNSSNLELESFLTQVHDWWWRSPMVNRYLNWDDHVNWPGPWDLLDENRYCDLARALGMLYTITLSAHPDIENITITQSDKGNLVLINHGKYILNWTPGELLNIDSTNIAITRQLTGEQLQQNLGYNT